MHPETRRLVEGLYGREPGGDVDPIEVRIAAAAAPVGTAGHLPNGLKELPPPQTR
jgi:hypothetical protein